MILEYLTGHIFQRPVSKLEQWQLLTVNMMEADVNLMEAANRFLDLGLGRLLVKEESKIIGVIREQDLFFEIANIIKSQNSNQ